MNILTGREEECSTLSTMMASGRPEFLALYGRRRVGKTFLVREFFKTQPVVFFNVTGSKNGTLKEQIAHFLKQVGTTFFGGVTPKSANNWDAAFEILTTAMSTRPDATIVLFFDELPWMDTRKSRLLPMLDYYWNQYWSDLNGVKLIICGSSASWIINKVIKNRGGLHNRITRKIHLQPFNLATTARFLQQRKIQLTHQQVTQLYMVTGGIPYYLTYVEKNLSAMQVIEKLAFNRDGILLHEFDHLFSSLFDEPEIYIKIIREIASCQCGIGQRTLLEKLGSSQLGGRGLSKLSALEEAGFIMSFKPHFHRRRGIYYKVIDEYTLFYLRWIEPISQTLQAQSLDPGNWLAMQNTPAWYNWQGYAFELVCYKHISAIRKKLNISPTAIANSWRYVPKKRSEEEGAQIDLLFDRDDNAITLCEIKYSNKPFTITKAYAKNLINKKQVFIKKTRTNKQIFFVIIATNGVKNNYYADDLISGSVTLDALFVE